MKSFKLKINNIEVNSDEIYKFLKNGRTKAAKEYIKNVTNADDDEINDVVNQLNELSLANRDAKINSWNKQTYERNQIVIDCTKPSPQSSPIRCPKCGSTAVTTGSRGFKLTTGFLGSNKTVNRCGKCGNTWQPRR